MPDDDGLFATKPLSQRLFLPGTKAGTNEYDGKPLFSEGFRGAVFRGGDGGLPTLVAVDQSLNYIEDGLFAADDQDMECC